MTITAISKYTFSVVLYIDHSISHTWRGQVQFRSIFNEHHELRQNNVQTPRTQPGNGGKFSVF